MKVLQFPPGFSIPNNNGTSLKTESETVYAIRSVNKGPHNYVSLGLLPVKDPKMVRPTNVITRPNHEIWKLKGGSEIKQWFTRSFPRLNFDELIDDTEWDRFAKAQGTSFPKCQYCPGLQVSSPDGSAGVVLVGDAIHAFPPDIGQGINSGLSDVEALDRALQGKDILTNEASDTPPASLGDALKEYERVRAPEVEALIRLARFGSPYQYRQPLYRDRVGRILWTMNVAMRMILNKLSRGLIPPAAIIMAQDKNMTFRKIMRRADLTTAGLTATLFATLFGVLRPFIKPT
jgi:2-polyprenyl-6-methoxyphenol hydroxylase-like FAD-dependent oxidoreductase